MILKICMFTLQPKDSDLFVKLKDLFTDIQYELDVSWAVLGEIYGKDPLNNQPKIKHRRITSNLSEESFLNTLPYVPAKISFQTDVELPKLLIAPLYGNNPTFGIRELIQNAVDACLERDFEEKSRGSNYIPEVKIEITRSSSDNDRYEFIITDNGKGMSLYEIKNYFLRVGASFRKSLNWKKQYTDEKGNSLINRSGRFGIGILAAFLLGDTIKVKTKHFKETFGFSFETTVETEQIELRIDNSIDNFGTEIKIKLSEEIAKLLEKNTDWTKWYVLDMPHASYHSSERQIPVSPISLSDKTWHTINPPNFKGVYWRYDYEERYWNKKVKEGELICNGILVSHGYEAFDRYPYQAGVIKNNPTLIIFDSEGVLPLTLDRNHLDGALPFLKELTQDLAKDFIASLLCLKIDPNKHIKQTENGSPNSTKVIFLKDGFTFEIDYFFDILQKQKYRAIKFITAFGELPFNPTFLENDCVLIPETRSQIKISYAEQDIHPRPGGGRVMLPRGKYDIFFDPGKKRVSMALKNSHKIESRDSNIVVYTINLDTPQSKMFTKLLAENFEAVQSIQEINLMSLRFLKSETITKKLLKKFFGKKVVIPYDFEIRKKVYSKAFTELESYMRKYLIPKNSKQDEIA